MRGAPSRSTARCRNGWVLEGSGGDSGLDPRGWLYTGDIGRLDAAGYLHLLDRRKDLIISGGSNVYPREVEDVLLQHRAIAAVAVVGLPHREWGETVHAAVVLRPGAAASARELIEFCRVRIASYKKPSGITFVDALPVSPVGKVLKRELREQRVLLASSKQTEAPDT